MSSMGLRIADQTRRQSYKRSENNRLVYKILMTNSATPLYLNTYNTVELNTLPRHSCLASISNRCILSGRSHGNLRHFKVTRMFFKNLAGMGFLPGVKKSSW